MNKQTKILLVLGTFAFMMLMVWLMSGSETIDEKNRDTFVSTNWSKKFQLYDKNPLGLYLFTSLTKVHLDQSHDLIEVDDWLQFDTLVKDNEEKKTFMFIGNKFGLKNSELGEIMDQVEEGSDFILGYNELTENIAYDLIYDFEFKFDYTRQVNVFAGGTKYSMINLYQNDTIACEWNGISDAEEDVDFETLSSFMELSNFVRIPHGDGNLYLVTTPKMFYNYQLKRLHGFKYAEYVLNALPKNRDIYLLELGRLSDNYGNYDIDSQEGVDGEDEDSYLRLIFKNPTLLAALMLSILGLILFVIFRSKRTRPIVPFVPKKKDMTLAFADTITSIYFAKRNPYGILQVQKKNFYATVHKHFFVDIQRREDDKPLEILAEKSDIHLDEIKSLLRRLETQKAFSVNDGFVAETLKIIHNFYRETGVISQELARKIEERELTFRRTLWISILIIHFALDIFIGGVYALMIAQWIGIILIPIGMFMLYVGIRRLIKPFIFVDAETITVHGMFFGKREYKRDKFTGLERSKNVVALYFEGGKKLNIHTIDITTYYKNKEQFNRFVNKLNTLEL
ncbi:MAG: hypothetical protein QNK23_07740 [Crocinitomicaceae bacterium]|nr:hypothetical protein [Crocinitomicaceae bacterium]